MSGLRTALGWPLRRVLNPRVRWTVAEIDARLGSESGLRRPIHERLDQLEALSAQHAALSAQRAAEQVTAIGGLSARAEQIAHEAATERRATDEGFAAIFEALRLLDADLDEVRPDYQVPPLGQRVVRSLTWPVAELLNWASGPHGYAAQSGLWSNPPVQVTYDIESIRVGSVNERIVEQAFVFGALADLAHPARILDVGGAESTIALALASLGHEATVVDPNGYPFEHANLRVRRRTLADLDEGESGFDAALALSSVEHFGRPHYGQAASVERLDLQATAELRRRVRPGGRLVLTVPLGPPSVDDFQRVYDEDGVRELVQGWEILGLSAAWQVSDTEWRRGEAGHPEGARGVALAVCGNPAPS